MYIGAFAILLAGLSFLLLTRLNTVLVYFQQEEYDAARFLRALKRIPLIDVIASLFTIALWGATHLFGRPGLVLALGGAGYAIIALRERRYKFKKAADNTNRLRRIRMLALLLAFPTIALPVVWMPLALLVLQLPPLLVILSNRLLAPYQKRADESFITEARRKLDEYQGIRIAVTGSYGKTTVKHLLGDLLQVSGPVFYSRGSVNTVLGLTRHVRERLQFAHKYLIAEMGAYRIGSIRRLCEFIRPSIGVISAVGDAHVERFGDVETIGRAKGELAEWVIQHGQFMVIAEQVAEFEPTKTLLRTHRDKFVTCGESANADVKFSTGLREARRVVEIDLSALDAGHISCEVPFMGEHAALNVALAVGVIARVAPDLLDQLPFLIPNVSQVPHRLELKERPGEPFILDDAYNSNEGGFRSAVNVLRELADRRDGRAVLVTPGIIELGDQHGPVHQRLGEHCARECDVVVVVNPSRIPTFIGALSSKDQRARLIEVFSLDVAKNVLSDLALGEKDVVLYENDLPDLLEGARVL